LSCNHLRGKGCKKCIIDGSKMVNFIEKANKIHDNKYDYSLVKYKSNKRKVKIICPVHGIFEQTPNNHISKKVNCPLCTNENRNINIDEFIKRSIKIHGNKYDYSLVDTKNKKVKIICPIHGIFEQSKIGHLCGGCIECKIDNMRLKTDEFIERSKKLHNNKYNYSFVEFKNVNQKIKIICPKHGVFEQRVSSHLAGHGCEKCVKITKNEYSKWVKYKSNVRNLTKKSKKKLLKNWEGYDYYDNQYIKENFNLLYHHKDYPTVDHKISLYNGYINNISPEDISNVDNLCITKRCINSSKNYKTEEEYNFNMI